jgi:aldose 1-epimerase
MPELRAGRLRCELSPELGGCVAGLWLDDTPVLRSTPAAQLSSARLAGSYPLVPFSNRIGHASLVWQGTQHPLVRSEGDEPHAIHGVGWQRPWAVLENSADSAMLSYEHRPDASWPFAFDCSHTLRLAPSGLEMTLALTNQSGQAAPAGLGWHPWFAKRPGGRIDFDTAAGRGLAAETAGLEVDRCYEGWNGLVRLRDARMEIAVRSGLTRLVVFTTPAEDAIAIGPVSHASNAVQLYEQGAPAEGLGLRILQPGETMIAQMAIEVEAKS